MDRELLESGLERIGIPFTGDTVDKISSYVGEIMLFNPAYKLVGDKDADEILIRHVLDSAAAYPVFREETEEKRWNAEFLIWTWNRLQPAASAFEWSLRTGDTA